MRTSNPSTNRAKRLATSTFNDQCIFTGTVGTDAAHIYSAGEFPQLVDCQYNIVPVIRGLHSTLLNACLDYRADGSHRPTSEKVWMVKNLCTEDAKYLMFDRLAILFNVCYQKGVRWDIQEPKDIESIMKMVRRE